MNQTNGNNNSETNARVMFWPGQPVTAGGRVAWVLRQFPTGAVEVLTDGGAKLTFTEGVSPRGEYVNA